MIKNLKEWETSKNLNDFIFQKQKNNTIKRKEIKCFNCGRLGHIKSQCRIKADKSKEVNLLKYNKNTKNEKDRIKIANRDAIAVFDTGACESVISKVTLNELENYKIENLVEPKIFYMVNDQELKVDKKVKLPVVYRNKEFVLDFYILDECKRHKILLSNEHVKLLKGETKKEIPIICEINTEGKGPVATNRKIKSFKDREEFVKLVDDLEKEEL